MILAADIGGTKTNLALFEDTAGQLRLVEGRSFPSRDFEGLEDIVQEFIRPSHPVITAACFGIAGPIIEDEVEAMNLPWIVRGSSLARLLKLPAVGLLNDLEANAYGIAMLRPEEFLVLNEGDRDGVGNAALISAGTGLGKACLFWDGSRHRPSASEGGHTDFAPRNELEIGLLRHLLKQYQHVSVERVISGLGLVNIYEYLKESYEEPSWLAERIAQEDDPNAVITGVALEGGAELCVKTLDLFVSVYGAEAGNLALTLKAHGGVYVGGGIAPKIIAKLKDGTFMEAFRDKGRSSPLMETFPVKVIMNDKTALLGAANYAWRASQQG